VHHHPDTPARNTTADHESPARPAGDADPGAVDGRTHHPDTPARNTTAVSNRTTTADTVDASDRRRRRSSGSRRSAPECGWPGVPDRTTTRPVAGSTRTDDPAPAGRPSAPLGTERLAGTATRRRAGNRSG